MKSRVTLSGHRIRRGPARSIRVCPRKWMTSLADAHAVAVVSNRSGLTGSKVGVDRMGPRSLLLVAAPPLAAPSGRVLVTGNDHWGFAAADRSMRTSASLAASINSRVFRLLNTSPGRRSGRHRAQFLEGSWRRAVATRRLPRSMSGCIAADC